MKIVVIGGTGLIGSKTVAILRRGGHEIVAGSPKSGVNSITGEGLKEATAGAQVVIDLANSPSLEDQAVLEFFETSGRNRTRSQSRRRMPKSAASCCIATATRTCCLPKTIPTTSVSSAPPRDAACLGWDQQLCRFGKAGSGQPEPERNQSRCALPAGYRCGRNRHHPAATQQRRVARPVRQTIRSNHRWPPARG